VPYINLAAFSFSEGFQVLELGVNVGEKNKGVKNVLALGLILYLGWGCITEFSRASP
jgi:hypothetical protein